MATGVDWLSKQRKTDLSQIAERVELESYEKMRKNDLETALEQHLRTNASLYASDQTLAPFYQGVDPASPVKHKGGKAVSGGMNAEEKKPRARRQTIKAKEDLDTDEATPSTSRALTTRTPSRSSGGALSLAKTVPLPPSPAIIANKIDAQTISLRRTLSSTLTRSQLPTYLIHTRNALSSVTSLHLLVLTIEALGLRTQVLPLKYITTIPAIPALGLNTAVHLKAPDFFALLTMAFWGPVGLWVGTSILVPLVGAWLVNFQRRGEGEREEGKRYDALSFGVVKAIVAWVVYVREGVQAESVGVVSRGVPGGAAGLLVGAAVGGGAAVWEAVLRREG